MGSVRFYFGVLLVAACMGFMSCSSASLLPRDTHRLASNKVKIEGRTHAVKASELVPYLKQNPNKSILFGIRFHLGMYLAAPPCDSCWLGKAMRTLGEAPVLFDPALVEQSNSNIVQYLRNCGYYNVQVHDTVIYKRHKAKVIYRVTPNSLMRIGSLRYALGNDSLARAVVADSANCLLKPNDELSVEMMNNERERLETLLHDKAFYSFGKNQLAFVADTLKGDGFAALTMVKAAGRDSAAYEQYKIRHVKVYSDYDQISAYTDSMYYERLHSLVLQPPSEKGEMTLYYRDSPILRNTRFLETLHLKPGDEYNGTRVNQLYNSLTGLNVFSVVNIQFVEVRGAQGEALVDCIVRLTPAKAQGFKFGFDASLSSNALFGLSPAVSYFHKNLFHGAEYLNLAFSGNFQFKFDDSKQRATEIAASPSLHVPRFLFPWLYKSMYFYSPHTEFLSTYSYQYRPDYTRYSVSLSFGYSWRQTSLLTYNITPINLNLVNVKVSPLFDYSIVYNPFLKNRYENHFVFGPSASVIYTDRQPDKRINSIYLRWNVKTAGNALSLFNKSLTNSGSGYSMFGSPYAQFVKTDLNLSYYQFFNDYVMMAYRVFGGVGRAYGNSVTMPFEEVYFSGGAYSLRGWQARMLGPGSMPPDDTTFTIPNQIGDMKLEANIEFRYKIFRALEGALFLEGGNIWLLNSAANQTDAYFQWNRFYKELAMNTGLGFRLNFGFLVIRLDWGLRIHDPAPGKGWIKFPEWLHRDNSAFHFGIGYPF
ncbi:MAG: BamA/TamA family outer membrane protein [Prevotellaceae bacterium]|jgi:outer membrane protein assembly factor BamA|nr:BamA/TamA family outer membrane protein [Prevotellaceae bacterium]